jgi:hypothetical protein
VLSGEKEMKVFLKLGILPLVVVIAGAATSPAVRAQSQPSPAPSTPSSAPSDPSIAQRKENQQDRIASGVQSGQLTAGETANLEKKESAINAETKADRSANGGTLTASQKTQINHEQNQASKNIYNKKHNGRTQGTASPK